MARCSCPTGQTVMRWPVFAVSAHLLLQTSPTALGRGSLPVYTSKKMTGIQPDEISLSLLQLRQTDP